VNVEAKYVREGNPWTPKRLQGLQAGAGRWHEKDGRLEVQRVKLCVLAKILF